MSGDELYALGRIGPSELIAGKIVRMSPTGYRHGIIEARLARLLQDWLESADVDGHVLVGEVGIYTGRNPDTVRGADVAWMSADRFARVGSHSYLDVAPELVVEIVSPDDRWGMITAKLGEYFAIGVERVWLVDPQRRVVMVYRSPAAAIELGSEDEMVDDELLPGFRASIEELLR